MLQRLRVRTLGRRPVIFGDELSGARFDRLAHDAVLLFFFFEETTKAQNSVLKFALNT